MDFLHRISYNFPISNFVEIHPVRVVLVCVDGWDMTKLIGAFCHYKNMPKKETLISVNSKIQPKHKSIISVFSE
jgi:hypothetical protein